MSKPRRTWRGPAGVALLALLTLWIVAPATARQTVERTGRAYRQGDDRLLYTETHREVLRGGRVMSCTVIYRDPRGRSFARRTLDFTGGATHPDFRLENSRTGHVEAAVQQGDRVLVSFRRSAADVYREKKLTLPDQAIIDAGFDRFVKHNWTRLVQGETVKRPFLVPSLRQFVDFRIYLEQHDTARVVFVMEPASFLLRLFGDAITVTYERNHRVLRRYRGISNLRDRGGENYMVYVEFSGAGAVRR